MLEILERAKLRSEFLKKRLDFSKRKEFLETSHKISQKLENFLIGLFGLEIKEKIIAYYYPFRGEVDISNLFINNIFKSRVAFPRIDGNIIKFYEISSIDDLKKSTYEILEPVEIINEVFPDIIITPGLVFDHVNKFRLGYGQGHYDKYFQRLSLIDLNPLKIGLCFEFQLARFKESNFDFPLDMIITDKLIYNKSPFKFQKRKKKVEEVTIF